jgi:Mrp family chromosome partitioning ATPase
MVMKDAISGILLVLRYAVTTFEELSDCMKQIELAQANVLGFVLNDVHRTHNSSYYNYKYKYKYKYGYGGYYGRKPETETAANDTQSETAAQTKPDTKSDSSKNDKQKPKGKKEK